MISLSDFNKSTARKRNDMLKRCKEKLWKTGKRAGTVRRPGRELGFTLIQFRSWAMKHIGMGTVRCHYCPRPIDVLHFEPDHYQPIELGGNMGLENLVPACEVCNRLKGAMPPADFISLMKFLETGISTVGRADITKRLRTGSMGIRLRFDPSNRDKRHTNAVPIPTTKEIDFF